MSPPTQNPPEATTPVVDGESREDGRSRSTSPRLRANSFAPDCPKWRREHGWTEGEWLARTKRKMDNSVAEDAMNVLVHSHRVRKTLKPLVGATLYTMEAQWHDKNTNKRILPFAATRTSSTGVICRRFGCTSSPPTSGEE